MIQFRFERLRHNIELFANIIGGTLGLDSGHNFSVICGWPHAQGTACTRRGMKYGSIGNGMRGFKGNILCRS